MTRRARITPVLAPAERRSLVGMAIVILALHVVGWGVLAGIVAPHSFSLGSGQVFGIGLGLTAYALGMRHAFDAFYVPIALAYPGKRLRIYFQDEARFGQQGTTTNVWAKTGSRPSAVRQTAYQYVWVMAAVCEPDGPQRRPARAAVGHPLHQYVLKSILTNSGSG